MPLGLFSEEWEGGTPKSNSHAARTLLVASELLPSQQPSDQMRCIRTSYLWSCLLRHELEWYQVWFQQHT